MVLRLVNSRFKFRVSPLEVGESRGLVSALSAGIDC